MPVCTARTWGPVDLRVLVIASTIGCEYQPQYSSLRYVHTLHRDGTYGFTVFFGGRALLTRSIPASRPGSHS